MSSNETLGVILQLWFLVLCDMPRTRQLGFQDPATLYMAGVLSLHDLLMILVLFILGVVMELLYRTTKDHRLPEDLQITRDYFSVKGEPRWLSSTPNQSSDKEESKPLFNVGGKLPGPVVGFSHATSLEVFWTCSPALALLAMLFPSFSLLYSMVEEDFNKSLTMKAVGHQWYWSYEYNMKSFFNVDKSVRNVVFDAYINV